MLKSLEHPDHFQEKDFKNRMRERVWGCLISLWAFSDWLIVSVTRWYFGNLCYQPFGFNRSGVATMLVVIMQLTPSIWWRFQYLQKSSKDMAQNIIFGP